ncbi:MAG: efflux RND transporter permease subunit [Myxococcales bacterium]|nr:efflux RND transporter permease subunit [Myxococcales bacterium]
MQWLSAISIRRPVFASVLILALVVVGAVSYTRLGVDKFPEVDFPIIVVTTIYPGASPTAVEADVTDKIEAAVNTVSGIDTLSSISTEGASLVVVQFQLEKDVDVAAQELRDKVSTLRDLPSSGEPATVQKLDPGAAPVINFAVRGPSDRPSDIRELTRIAETIVKRRLESIAGVGQVQVIGGQKRQIRAVVDPARLRAYGISALEVQRAIGISNASIPGGRLELGAKISSMRIDGRATSPAALGDIVVRQVGNTPVRVSDLIVDGKIEDTVDDPTSLALRDGQPTILVSVTKQSGANTIEVVDTAKATLASIAGSLPAGYSLDIVRDNSELVRTSTSQVLEHLVVGSLLAALVVLMFLGDVRSTIISAIAIPVSIIGSFLLMAWAGYTLNMITLLALALAVGIVIDDAIVVLENIHRFIEEKGMKPFPAAMAATKEIGLAVMATTLSLMAVFLPVAFMSGIVGRFLSSFGLTMAFAILVSMLVSFTLTPMMAARMLKPHDAGRTPNALQRFSEAFYRPIERVYLAMLRWSMTHRWVIVLVSVGLMFTVPTLAGKAGAGFLPQNDEAHFEIYIKTKEGSGLDATTLVAERIARRTRALPGVAHTLVTVGANTQEQPNVANVYVRLVDPNQRTLSQDAIMELARKRVLGMCPRARPLPLSSSPTFRLARKTRSWPMS